MSEQKKIVPGWYQVAIVRRLLKRKAYLFMLCAVYWTLATVVIALPILTLEGPVWLLAPAYLIVLAHVAFIVMAVYFWFTEKPSMVRIERHGGGIYMVRPCSEEEMRRSVTNEKPPSGRQGALFTLAVAAWMAIMSNDGIGGEAVSAETGSSKSQRGGSVTTVGQWRPSLSGQYPLLEVFCANGGATAIEFKKSRLNGIEIRPLTNGVMWVDYYPSEKAAPGQTIALTICLGDFDEYEPQTVTVETQDGQAVECKLKPFYVPGLLATPERQITATTFSRQFDRVFVTYAGQHVAKDEAPPRIAINGKDCTPQTKVLQVLKDGLPGLLAVRLASATGPGKPIHVRLGFSDGEIAQSLVRASTGIFLDDFTVAEGNEALRRQLHLDLRPFARNIGSDPACSDVDGTPMPGRCAPNILTTRRDWYRKYPDQLSYDYLCTASSKSVDYPLYGRIVDAIQACPYELRFEDPKFVESEESYFVAARKAACPRPWFWIPQAFCSQKFPRILEPSEIRLLALGAMGQACKGIRFYSHTEQPPLFGWSKSPPLLKEIIALNADIKNLEPVLGASIHLSYDTMGDPNTGCRVYTLWAPDASSDEDMVVVVRNLDYRADREANDLGLKPRCKVFPKKNVTASVARPPWMKVKEASDALTHQPVAFKEDGANLTLEAGDFELGRIIWIKNGNG